MEGKYMCAVCLEKFKHKSSVYSHITKKEHSVVNSLSLQELPVNLSNKWKYGNCHFLTTDTENPSLYMYIYDFYSNDDILKWMNTYMKENGSVYVRYHCKLGNDGQITYVEYRCEHYNDPNRETRRKHKIKGTGCKSTIRFSLKRGLADVKILRLYHNHSKELAAVLTFSKPTVQANMLIEMDNSPIIVTEIYDQTGEMIDLQQMETDGSPIIITGIYNQRDEPVNLQDASKKEIESCEKNFQEIMDIIKKDPNTYEQALKVFNEHLVLLKKLPSLIIPAFYSFNRKTVIQEC